MALPATYPGCWQDDWFRRLYKREWTHDKKREDPSRYEKYQLTEKKKRELKVTCFYCHRESTGKVERIVAEKLVMVEYCGNC